MRSLFLGGVLALGIRALALGGPSAWASAAPAQGTATVAVAAQAASGACTNATLSGAYVYSFNGYGFVGTDGTPQAGGTPVPVVAAGMISYDGGGAFAGSDFISTGGNVRPRQYTGSYTVSPDCTGTGTIEMPSGPIHTSFVISDDGEEMQIIVTDPGTGLLGSAHKQ